MSVYELRDVNRRIKADPDVFVRECDRLHAHSVLVAANSIRNGLKSSPIVLLAGPSGSGKTTTALMVEAELERQGVSTVTVSMDDYFKTLDPKTAPRTPEGDIDFESPDCLDVELLNAHFDALSRGEPIAVPKFHFDTQRRGEETTLLTPAENKVVIFEGIHALRDSVTDAHPEACKLYISAYSAFAREGELVFPGAWVRLLRRLVRDNNFRGSDAHFTLSLWGNVLRGEALYIDPYVHKADIALDSTLPYEPCVMKRFAVPLLAALPVEVPRRADVDGILSALHFFEPLNPAFVDNTSLLREFLGGSIFHNH